MRTLCKLAHNLAREDSGCAAVVAELGTSDPVSTAVPHWRRLSWDEDVWCMKRLTAAVPHSGNEDENYGSWERSQPASGVIFVDPRDF